MNNNPEVAYYNIVAETQKEITQLNKRLKLFSILRGAMFLIAIFAGYKGFEHHYQIGILLFLFGFIPFLGFVKYSLQLKSKLSWQKEYELVNKRELEALGRNISVFRNGEEFIDPDHPYSFDLDIFGEKSVFQFLNRTCSSFGYHHLARHLQFPEENEKKILGLQEAIKELTGLLTWRQHFIVTGNLIRHDFRSTENQDIPSDDMAGHGRESLMRHMLTDWLEKTNEFLMHPFYRIFLIAGPASALILLGLNITGVLPFIIPALFALIQLFFVGFFLKKTNAVHQLISQKSKLLDKYSKLLEMVENQTFKSDHLKGLQNTLEKDKIRASQNLRKLKSIVKSFDNRLNMIFAILANALFLWDLQCIVRLERWKQSYRKDVPVWFETIGRFDALTSLANYAFNHPGFCYPEILPENDFQLTAKQAGHLLIPEKERVNNDFSLKGRGAVGIITGANMAGKSTFLRTIGLNITLGMCGVPVCAEKFAFSIVRIYTSIRVTDSVQKHESYFFAELKRLKQIISELDNETRLFVIIDEMLRGTNSKDKHTGSEAFIKKMIRLNTNGLVATHDISLGSMKDDFPGSISNYRFEVDIEGDKLSFDFILKPGISKNMNATILMNQMGIID